MEEPEALSAREKVLVEGQHDWVKLWDVHRHIAEENSSSTLIDVQRKTLALVESLLRERLAEVGVLSDHGSQFEPWMSDPTETMKRLTVAYIDNFDDRAGWPWTLWLRLTDAGRTIGAGHEPAYRQWPYELRAQGQEYQAIPARLQPRS